MINLSDYVVHDTSTVYSPALLFYLEHIRHNIARCLDLAGSPAHLRPHCKTHKTREIIRMLLEAGVEKHKVATLAEAEMVASCGVRDILIAYPMVGPNQRRLLQLASKFPQASFSVLVDAIDPAIALANLCHERGTSVGVWLDIDLGQHRTGIAAGPEASELYMRLCELEGLEVRGLHLYDGHNHQSDPQDRRAAVQRQLEPVLAMCEDLRRRGSAVPALVAGGTPTFPIWASLDLAGLECSPGTCILHDSGYGGRFPDLADFRPAALLLTRVISRPTPNRVTFDLGYKAVASDPPAGNRCQLIGIGPYEAVLQNEEHLVIETKEPPDLRPGDEVLAVPTHICPTCNLHQHAYVVESGNIVDRWQIVGRDRVLTV